MTYCFYDTSALLNSNNNFSFKNQVPVICSYVLQELENIKNSNTKSEEVKCLARKAVNTIRENSSVLKFSPDQKKIEKFLKKNNFLLNNNDSRILAAAVLFAKGHSIYDTSFYTSDTLLYFNSLNFTNYLICKFVPQDESSAEIWKGWNNYNVSDETFSSIYSNPANNILGAPINEYCKIIENNEVKEIVRWDGNEYARLNYKTFNGPLGEKIAPLNVEQKMLFDLFQNPNIPIKLVTSTWGCGKAIDDNAMIPMFNGTFKRMGDIKVGDELFDRKGNMTKVIAVFPQGTLPAYEVSFSDGRTCVCNDKHLWTYYENNELKTLTLKEMMENGIDNHYKIPLCQPLNTTGNISEPLFFYGTQYNGNDENLIKTIMFKDFSEKYGFFCGIIAASKAVDDTDENVFRIKTKSLSAAIALSNMLFTIMMPNKREFADIVIDRKEVIRLHTTFVNYDRNKEQPILTTEIVEVKKVSPRPMTCILVDNDEHLFLANDFIVTHNTYLAIAHILHRIKKGEFNKMLYVRNNFNAEGTNDIGSLPGDTIEKIYPYMKPIVDYMGKFAFEDALATDLIEPEHLGFIRGRNLDNTAIFVDEAANLTSNLVQLLVARVGKGSEIFFAGDIKQTDNVRFRKDNGMIALSRSLKGNPLFGTVHLVKTERSAAAELASKIK